MLSSESWQKSFKSTGIMVLKYALQFWMCTGIIVLLCKLIYNLCYLAMYLEVDLKADIKMKYVCWSISRTSSLKLYYLVQLVTISSWCFNTNIINFQTNYLRKIGLLLCGWYGEEVIFLLASHSTLRREKEKTLISSFFFFFISSLKMLALLYEFILLSSFKCIMLVSLVWRQGHLSF